MEALGLDGGGVGRGGGTGALSEGGKSLDGNAPTPPNARLGPPSARAVAESA